MMARLSRRQFLAHSSVAATAAAFSPSAFARPNDVLRVAVAGVRGRGMDHVKAYLAMKDVQIAAICDVDENVIETFLNNEDANKLLSRDYRKPFVVPEQV